MKIRDLVLIRVEIEVEEGQSFVLPLDIDVNGEADDLVDCVDSVDVEDLDLGDDGQRLVLLDVLGSCLLYTSDAADE